MAKDSKATERTIPNARFVMFDDELHIIIDISEMAMVKAPPSKTGKTNVVSSTHGFMVLPGPHGLKLNLNLTTERRGGV